MLTWVVGLSWALETCSEVDGATWRSEVEAALAAYAALDEAAFVAAAERAERDVTCVVDLLQADDAVAWHVLGAVRAWYADPEHTELPVLHLRAALASGLTADRYTDVLVGGSPLGDLRAAATAALLQPTVYAGPLRLRTGGLDDRGPTDTLPALTQLAQGDRVWWTRAWTEAPLLVRPKPGLGQAAAALGVATAASLGVAIGTRVAWADFEARTPGLRTANHVAIGAAAGLGATCTGLGVAAILETVRVRRAP